MQHLQPPDSHHFNAALGWLGLGARADAAAELDRISGEHQWHPDVLELRWEILAADKEWGAALEIARKLLTPAPERASGWLNQAYALRRAPEGSLEKAWDALKPAADRFPKVSLIPYNLSCYACQMAQLDEARAWLKRAMQTGGKQRIKKLALSDPDLEPLWQEIRKL